MARPADICYRRGVSGVGRSGTASAKGETSGVRALKTVAICNHKGGSAKTTTAVNLAAALGEAGRRVLVVDLDPQASASRWLGADTSGRGLYECLVGEGSLAELVEATDAPGVAVVASSAMLAGVEKALAGEIGAETVLRRSLGRMAEELRDRAARAKWEPEVVSTADFVRFGSGRPEEVWQRAYRAAGAEEREGMSRERRRRATERARAACPDLVVLDCPPAMGALQVNALAAADAVVVPVEARFMALVGLAQVLETVDRVRERIHPGLRVAGVLACRVDGRTRHGREVAEDLRTHFGDLVFRTAIRENVRLAEAAGHGQPVTRFDRRSSGAADYRAFAEELYERLPS